MTAQVEQTLNVTIAQIEDALLAGQTVPDFAREWSEPPANVLAVFRRLQREGRIPSNAPSQVATSTAPALASVPNTTTASSAALTLDALVNAAARSSSKRTQALGVRLADLATVVRDRLAEERAAAEKADRVRREREVAAAEVARLEEQLRAARAKLRSGGRGGSGSVQSPKPSSGSSLDRAAAMAKARAAAVGEFPCSKGCGKVATTKAGLSSHERHCAGAS